MKLSRIALDACKQVYRLNTDLGTSEYAYSISEYQDKPLQVVAVAGTNEPRDWLRNLDIRQMNGMKRSAVVAANEILTDLNLKNLIKPDLPLMFTGHSKGTGACVALMKDFGADYCVLFNPVRCISRKVNNAMDKTTMFIDKEDIVSKLAFISFNLPDCQTIIKPSDSQPWWKIMHNHGIEQWDGVV